MILNPVTGEISIIMDTKSSDLLNVSGHVWESNVKEREKYVEELYGNGIGFQMDFRHYI